VGWEKRGKRLVYFRATKIKGRVVKQYVGCGLAAQQIALEDALRRADREAARAACHAARQWLREVERPAFVFTNGLKAIVRATLLAAGYRRHDRGQWRLRRA
jgi:citrate lyase beta subunit